MKQKTYFKAKIKAPELTKEQEAYLKTFGQIQQSTMEIDMLTGMYTVASLHQDSQKKQRCADLMVERAKVLLEAAEKLAKF